MVEAGLIHLLKQFSLFHGLPLLVIVFTIKSLEKDYKEDYNKDLIKPRMIPNIGINNKLNPNTNNDKNIIESIFIIL
jgi:hypothetical protein